LTSTPKSRTSTSTWAESISTESADLSPNPAAPEVLTDLTAVEKLLPEWRALAATSSRAALDSPDWLLPLARRYLQDYEVRVLAWRDGGQLVGVAPFSLIADKPPLRPIRQLALWGTIGPRMRGLVDVLARDDQRAAVLDGLCDWLAANRDWDVLRVVRPQVDSPTPKRVENAAARGGWNYVPFSNVRSTTFQLDLPDSGAGWEKHLGSKARKVMRWEMRKFADHGNGRIEAATGDAAANEALDALERLLRERWGDAEVYFVHDPAFRGFVHEAVPAMVANDAGWISVARNDDGIQGVLVSLSQNGYAMALSIAMTTDPAFKSFSLGKHLFDAGLAEAVRRGAHSYDFLWVGGYKESFWHATPRQLQSAMVGRGTVGKVAARFLARRG
jgi:CelD/BcsL family acetyltransferase involved in cellulose biosynthesis